MKSSNSTSWDLSRFVKTLSYFGAIPFLSRLDWFQHMLGSRPDPTLNSAALAKPGTVSVGGVPATPEHQRVLFDFAHPAGDVREIWGALDDVVMGGVSESNIRLLDNAALFSGNVSTANSGGFASVRTRNFDPPLDLADADGIELRVKGDGNRYKFMLRSENRWDGIAYCYSFDTVANVWTTVRIPFDALIPVFRAKTVPTAGHIDTHQITALQLMLSKFEYDGGLNPAFSAGSFQLQIETICTYRTEPFMESNSGNCVALDSQTHPPEPPEVEFPSTPDR